MIETSDEAIPLLIYDKTTKNFTLTEKGESILKELPSPFGVISVAGMYRTGKSYLLNRMLLNKSNGFSVGPSINPCTKGLWMWSAPLRSFSNNSMPIMIIDTEGFGAFDEDHNHDVRIFTLSILLSSFFIYNSVGSIDENSIQSLSFVINLSKHISMKMKSENNINNESSDIEELSNIFPQFLWVLRDFSLQLINEEGEEISSKDYLENVLEERIKGVASDDQKNKIRKLIKSYFKERDCHTLVRPLTGEELLQNLENIPFEQLRPEFVNSVCNLRKKVLGGVKPKSLKGKNLNGEMFVNIIKSILISINSGAIPNIENTWDMMCKIESSKALELAEKIYDDHLKEKFEPDSMNESLLENIHREAKNKCLEIFKKKSVGDISTELEKLLKSKLKEKYNFYQTILEEEKKNHLTKILQKHFSMIEYKVHSKEILRVDQIENEFKLLESKTENYNDFKLKDEMINSFKYKVFGFCLEFFQNQFENEITILNSKMNELTEKYNIELNELKTSNEKEIAKKTTHIENQKVEIYNLRNQYSLLKEDFALLQNDRDQQIKQLNDKLSNQKDESDSTIKELSEKLSYIEEKKRESERRVITIQGEYEKQKALLDQRIEFYSKQLEDYNKREKESVIELRSQIKEQQNAIKDNNSKYENIIKSLNNQIEELQEKIVDYETIISGKESLLEIEKSKLEEHSIKHNMEVEDLNEKLGNIKNKLESERIKFGDEIRLKETEYSCKYNISLNKIEELELKMKNSEENSKSIIIKIERENAILKQNNEFLELQLKELNNLMEEQKKSHESILTRLEMKSSAEEGQEEYTKKIEELKEFFSLEKKQLEENFEKTRQLYLNQIDSLTEKVNETECKMKIEKEEFQKDLNECKIKLDKAKRDYDNTVKENQSLIESAQLNNEDISRRIKKLTADYEKKLEEKEQKHQRDQTELNRSSEETINQLRHLFEQEKVLFDEKLRDDKLKNEKKMKALIEEYENKLHQQEAELKEEIENLNEDLQTETASHNNFVTQAEHEIGLLQQKNETLEQYLNETKDALNQNQIQSRQILEREMDNYKKDRNEFLNKIEALNIENNNKEKELTSFKMKKDQLEYLLQEKENYVSMIKKEYDDEKKELVNKIETLKSKNQSVNDDFMMKKLEFTRENALLKQQIEFQDKKIEELQRNIEENQKKYEDKLFSLRNEVERDLIEKYDRIKRDRDEFESKFLSKKKEMRDLEQNYIRQSSLVEKDKTILNEKINALESKKKELIDNYEKELETMTNSLKALKDEKIRENEVYSSELESLRKKNFTLEQIINELKGSNEKEKVLWEGRFKFLESQREQLKKEYIENQKKFETIFDNFQKKTSAEKEKLETNHNNTLIMQEKKYNSEIKELKENHQKLYSDLLNLNKDLERELKALNLQQELRGKSLDPSAISKRISELLEVQERMKRDLDDARREKEIKITEIQSMCDREKEILKVKINDIENRLREVEGKRGQLMLEYEKDKAKFSLEKDHLDSKNKELQDTLDRLEKKVENLLRENEKLKNDKNIANNNSLNKQRTPSNTNIKNSVTGYVNNSTILPNYNNLNISTATPIIEKDLNNYNQPKLFNPYSSNNLNYVKPILPNNLNNLEKSLNYNDLNNDSNRSNSNIYYPNNKSSHKFSIRQVKQNPSNNDK